jgi:hypothetical protein
VGYRGVTNANKALQRKVGQFGSGHSEYSVDAQGKPIVKYVKGGPGLLSQLVSPVTDFVHHPGVGTGAQLAAAFVPGGKGTRGEALGLRGSALEQAVAKGEAAGGKVTSKLMSGKQLAEYKAKLGGQAGKPSLRDVIEQHGERGMHIPGNQAGLDNLLEVAKHPGHSNTTFYTHEGPPDVQRALRGAENTITKFVVTKDGKIGVGDLGMHHDQIMQRMGLKGQDRLGVVQGELHHAQPDMEHPIPATVHAGRSIMADLGVGQAKQNRTQTAAIHDWLSKGNKGEYAPIGNPPTHARGHLSMGGDPMDNRRAVALTKRLAAEPNPLDNPAIPSALKLAGMRDARARNEASRVGGGPTVPQDFLTKPKERTAPPLRGGSVKVSYPNQGAQGGPPIIKVVKDRTDPRYGK